MGDPVGDFRSLKVSADPERDRQPFMGRSVKNLTIKEKVRNAYSILTFLETIAKYLLILVYADVSLGNIRKINGHKPDKQMTGHGKVYRRSGYTYLERSPRKRMKGNARAILKGFNTIKYYPISSEERHTPACS